MAKLVPAILVLLVIASFGGPGSVDSQSLDNLQYPRKSFMETLMTPSQVDTSDLDNLEYPKDSLISSIISRLVGAFTRISSAARSFSDSLPPQMRNLLDFIGQFFQSMIGINVFGSNNARSDPSFDDDDFKDFDSDDVSLPDLPKLGDDDAFIVDPPVLNSFPPQSVTTRSVTLPPSSTTEPSTTATEKTSTESSTTTTTEVPSTKAAPSETPSSEPPIEEFLNEV